MQGRRVRQGSLLRRGLIVLAILAVPALFAAPALAAPSFGPANNFSEPLGFPTAITTADYDGDGNLDLFYEVSTQGFRISLGNGDGTFDPPTPVPASGHSQDWNGVTTAQINTDVDSSPDVIVTPTGGGPNGNILVLLNAGGGAFTSSTHALGGTKTRPLAVAVGDLNGDGDPDLAVTTISPPAATDNLVILLGDGNGGFSSPTTVARGGQATGGSPIPTHTDVAIGHLDADTNLDIVVSNGGSANFTVLLGNGDGTFDPPVAYTTGGTSPRGTVLRDFDGDGELDVAVTNAGSENVGIRLGVGDGTFGPVSTYGVGAGANANGDLLATDINFDGVLDLVTTNQSSSDFSVLMGIFGGSFSTGVRFAAGGPPWETVAGDFNEDTRPDLAIVRGTHPGPAVVSVFLNTTDETPPNTTITGQPDNPTDDPNASFTFTGSDPPVATLPLTFQCRRDGGLWNACTSPENYAAAEGTRTFEVRAIDGKGNVDPTPASFTWNVDLTDPTVTATNKQRFALHGGPLLFSCADPDPDVGGPIVPSGVNTCTSAPAFNNEDLGPHLATITATDNAGNTETKTVVYIIEPAQYGPLVLADDPVAYYRHNEPYPSTQTPQEIDMLDSSGNEHHGTYKNNVALGRQGALNCARRPHPPRACEFTNDPENKAAYFPERDGYGYVNGISAPTSGYTMEAWVKPRANGAMMIMSHGGGGQLYRQANNRLALRQTQDVVADTNAGGFDPIDTGEWTHVAASWDGGTTRLFVNGVLVQSSNAANKPPSGTSTFYVGYGEMAPWFHGDIDESAYYDHALSQHALHDRWKTGAAFDHPTLPGEPLNGPNNTGQPFTDPVMPKNTGLYAPGKVPNANFTCSDPDDAAPFPAAGSDIASCTATVQKTAGAGAPGPVVPVANGGALPDALGTYAFVVTATDKGTPPNVYVHTHTYTVRAFKDIYLTGDIAELKAPLAYYRLGEPSGGMEMFDSSPNEHHGEYKNGQSSSPTGISGDGNAARDFNGQDGYGYANGIQAPNYQSTLEAWVHPDNLNRNQSILGQGDGGEIFLEGGVFKFRHGSQNRVVSSSPPYAPNPNSSYTQVVGTWDGVDLRIWVNGELEGTLESNRGPTSSSTFYVGYGEIKPWFDGRIDEVAYYPIALSANRVKQHFLADPAADDSGPPAGGSGGGGESGGGSAGGGDTGGGGDGGGDSGDSGDDASADSGDPAATEGPKAAALQKCLKRAYKIGNKKKRHKAVKKCRATYGAS